MQEIKAESLLSRHPAWTKLLGRCSYRFPQLLKTSPRLKGTAMSNPASLFLVLLGFVSPCLHSKAVIAQKLEKEVTRAGERRADAISHAACQYDPNDDATAVVYRTAACPRPRSFVQDEIARSIPIGSAAIRRNIETTGKWLNLAERKSGERYVRTIQGSGVFNDERRGLGREFIDGLTQSQIKSGVDFTVLKHKPMGWEINRLTVPSIIRFIDRHDARDRSLQGRGHEVIDNVASGNEITGIVNKESGAVDQLKRELSAQIEFPTQYRENRVLYSLNRQDESVGTGLGQHAQAPEKKEQKKDLKSTGDPHTSGVLSIKNDGKAVGCDVSGKTSSAIIVVCPQIDSVGAHKEAPQPTKHDPSNVPPSRE